MPKPRAANYVRVWLRDGRLSCGWRERTGCAWYLLVAGDPKPRKMSYRSTSEDVRIALCTIASYRQGGWNYYEELVKDDRQPDKPDSSKPNKKLSHPVAYPTTAARRTKRRRT
jgi:hypothetical protein